MTDMRPIVVGYDGRGGSRPRWTRPCASGAGSGCRSRRVLLRGDAARAEARDLDDAIDERGRAVLAEAVARAGGAGAPIETEQRARPPMEGLLEEAEERDAQMIVVGSTGEGPLRGVLVGSTAYKLLHAEHPAPARRATGD